MSHYSTVEIGRRVQSGRETKKWSRVDLADATSLPTATITQIEESGNPNLILLEDLARIAQKLGVSVTWLLDGEPLNLLVEHSHSTTATTPHAELAVTAPRVTTPKMTAMLTAAGSLTRLRGA